MKRLQLQILCVLLYTCTSTIFGMKRTWDETCLPTTVNSAVRQDITQHTITIDQLPLEILEIIFQDVTKDNFLLHHIARLKLLTPQMYDKIAEHYADHLPFYPKQEDIDAIISTNFATTCTASLPTEIFQANIRHALNTYIINYPFGSYKDTLDAGQDTIFIRDLHQQMLTTKIAHITNFSQLSLENRLTAFMVVSLSSLSQKDKEQLHQEYNVYVSFIERSIRYIERKINASNIRSIIINLSLLSLAAYGSIELGRTLQANTAHILLLTAAILFFTTDLIKPSHRHTRLLSQLKTIRSHFKEQLQVVQEYLYAHITARVHLEEPEE